MCWEVGLYRHGTYEDIASMLAERTEALYVYALVDPTRSPCFSFQGTPFYIGLGRGLRLVQHEKSSGKVVLDRMGREKEFAKKEVLRALASAGLSPVYVIDSLFPQTQEGRVFQDQRETELIIRIGLSRDDTGPLTNRQRYHLPYPGWQPPWGNR